MLKKTLTYSYIQMLLECILKYKPKYIQLFSLGYEDVDDYLDVQFRLFREDFVSTIRDGVKTVRRKPGLAQSGKRLNGSFRVFNDFNITGFGFSNQGFYYILR